MSSLTFNASGQLTHPTEEELASADANSNILVYMTSTLADGRPYYAYVAIKPSRYSEFMALCEAKQEIILEEYGEIIASGFESSPPPEVIAMMRNTYGFDENYLEKLRKEVSTQRMDAIVNLLKKNQPDS